MHPFVALMRTYCIDYTNSHDQSLYEQIMEDDYVVHIGGADLIRSTTYADSVSELFAMAPGLGLVVHELVLNGDRLCMYFSEHAAMPGRDGTALACWRGIGLYKWNGRRLTENYVEQDHFAMRAQLRSGTPHPLLPPHLDPWVTTEPVASDEDAERVVRAWLERGDLEAAARVHIDDGRAGSTYEPLVDVAEVRIEDLFSAGASVPFHATLTGAYRGGLGPKLDDRTGTEVSLPVAGIARVEGGQVTEVEAVTARLAAAGVLAARA
jgi:hypothetical protein